MPLYEETPLVRSHLDRFSQEQVDSFMSLLDSRIRETAASRRLTPATVRLLRHCHVIHFLTSDTIYTVVSERRVGGLPKRFYLNWRSEGHSLELARRFAGENYDIEEPFGFEVPREQIRSLLSEQDDFARRFAEKYVQQEIERVESEATRHSKGVTVTMPNAPRRLDAFLCHSSGDKDAVRDLYHRLQGDGFEPWLDEEDLLPGQDWAREISRAVRAADVVLVCLSQASIAKTGFVQKEIGYALDAAEERPPGTIYVIPVKLEECEVPERLRQYQWVSLFEEGGYERLMRALRERASSLGLATVSVPSSAIGVLRTPPSDPAPVESRDAEERAQPSYMKVALSEFGPPGEGIIAEARHRGTAEVHEPVFAEPKAREDWREGRPSDWGPERDEELIAAIKADVAGRGRVRSGVFTNPADPRELDILFDPNGRTPRWV